MQEKIHVNIILVILRFIGLELNKKCTKCAARSLASNLTEPVITNNWLVAFLYVMRIVNNVYCVSFKWIHLVKFLEHSGCE